MKTGELPRAGARSDRESKSSKQTSSRVSLAQQEQLGESSTRLGGKECHCLCWCCLKRSSVPLEILRAPLTRWSLAGDCAFSTRQGMQKQQQVGKSWCHPEWPHGAKREDLGFSFPSQPLPSPYLSGWPGRFLPRAESTVRNWKEEDA